MSSIEHSDDALEEIEDGGGIGSTERILTLRHKTCVNADVFFGLGGRAATGLRIDPREVQGDS